MGWEAKLNEDPSAGMITIGAVDRLAEVMRIRNADEPDEWRSRTIGDLWMIRSMLVHCGYPETSDGKISERVLYLFDQLGMLERTSLGTAAARGHRAKASAETVAEIMARHIVDPD